MRSIAALDRRNEPVYVDGVVVPHSSPRRQWWYIMEDRHWHKAPIDKSLVGKEVLVSRVIVRTGYFFQHTDMDYYDLRKTTDEFIQYKLARSFGLSVDKFIEKLDITKEDFGKYISNMGENFGYNIRTRALYNARREWIAKANALPEYKKYNHLRAFWYVNIADVSPESRLWLRVKRIKQHIVGEHYPPSSTHYSGPDGEDYDYSPGGIAPGVQQAVYTSYAFLRNYEDYYNGVVEIHPLDVLDSR